MRCGAATCQYAKLLSAAECVALLDREVNNLNLP
jgi:hypothetical protein